MRARRVVLGSCFLATSTTALKISQRLLCLSSFRSGIMSTNVSCAGRQKQLSISSIGSFRTPGRTTFLTRPLLYKPLRRPTSSTQHNSVRRETSESQPQAIKLPVFFPFGFWRSVVYPFAFTVVFSGGCIYLVEHARLIRRSQFVKNVKSFLSSWDESLRGIPGYEELCTWWSDMPEYMKPIWTILLGNVAVYLLWLRAGSSARVFLLMHNYFLNTTLSPRAITLLSSCFSHRSFPHLAFNMFALYSFGPVLCQHIGNADFWALYLSGGVISSLISHLVRLALRSPTPSVGASGALLAVLSALSVLRPDIQVSIMFVSPPFSLADAIWGLVIFDLCGLLFFRNRSILDHAGHLGGVAAGFLYMEYLKYRKKKGYLFR
jgi:membrane associated rhomboid family serine protease